jgi:hypothetical protein
VSAIRAAKTALDAKKLGDTILPSESFTSNKVDLMTEIIEAKSNQVPEFRDALFNSKKTSVFVETTYDDFWASGFGKDATITTSRRAWPGSNKLGDILARVAARIRRPPRSNSAPRTGNSHGKSSVQPEITQMIQDVRTLRNSSKNSRVQSQTSDPEVEGCNGDG